MNPAFFGSALHLHCEVAGWKPVESHLKFCISMRNLFFKTEGYLLQNLQNKYPLRNPASGCTVTRIRTLWFQHAEGLCNPNAK